MTNRIGIIGAGGIGQAHIKRLSGAVAGAQVVAVNDIDQARAATVAAGIGATVYATDKELIASPEVDSVLVASFGPAHEASVVAAIEAGKPVLCEKPLSPQADGCLRIMAAEQRAGRRLVTVGFMRRFDPAYGEIKAVIESGDLGLPLIVHNRHRNPTVPQSYTADMAINDSAIHEIDTMRWLLGEEIVSARVDRPRPTSNRFEHLQDPLVLVLTTTSGAIAYDEVFVNIGYGYDIRCEVVLETGTVALTAQAGTERRDAAGARHRIASDHNDRFRLAFLAELQQWSDAVSRGQHAGSTSWDGYAAAAVCDAGVRASGTSETVPVAMIEKPAFYA
ncbi:MAG: Gfo/Idh/MocA family oxidoreductase [Propionibacteriaceae bacterium]|jgi:myo-inositol 2-dehydrogenase/D-chiro-inositol 1-dehydrogenase|nr:Gfo/Idh/MocA family oxidoreductase [Propionibacteriaceae bacterium]